MAVGSTEGVERALEKLAAEYANSERMEVGINNLLEVLTENRRLRAQVTQLQTAATGKVIERRAAEQGRSELSGQVEAFMHAFDQPVRRVPGIPADADGWHERAWIKLRAELQLEEAFEFVEAAVGDSLTTHHVDGCSSTQYLDALKRAAIEYVRSFPENYMKLDMVAMADALADTMYVTEGAFLTIGVDSGAVLREVHRSNMAKVGGPVDPVTKKKLKPLGWTPPDITTVLIKQGWKS
jgi:predicted HAD superfamily Cof-like phosphohydrolase